ncbi:MAG: VWA domain-containing protein [Aliifodinibius sp.]|nr:VWA domain-containing protein [candidate division Zixibacteria bacterium]NIT57213.1 VWA domain-containing protein [Fodinibius sp.]NIW40169.1 VWA domain-containing protein [candidate division Zixibacteria bacterium]NIY25795.1 VWA domain-containing protein [Fodinibius sp.]
MRTLLVLFILATAFQLCSATTINIPADYPSIQAGINASSNGDTVLVQPGLYMERISFKGRNIVLASLFDATGDTSYISSTIIDGDSSGTVVTFNNSESNSAVITGFTIKHGYAMNGGGIFCNGSQPTIQYNTISQNYADDNGGGINCVIAKPYIYKNTIKENIGGDDGGDEGGGISCVYCPDLVIMENDIFDNYAYSGGGISCFESDPIISANVISNNLAEAGGGIGLCCGSNSSITGNLISNNDAYNVGGAIYSNLGDESLIKDNIITGNEVINWGDGGAICCNESNASIEKNLIFGNDASRGGGLAFSANSNCSVINNTIAYNHAIYGSAAFCRLESDPLMEKCILAFNMGPSASVYCMENSNPVLICCDVYGNEGGDWVGCIASQSGLNNNFSMDPVFCNAQEEIYNISVTSPCAPNNNECEDLIGSEEAIYCQNNAVLAIDKSGSMSRANPLGESRLKRAKSIAHDEIDQLLDPEDVTYPGIFQVAVISFNADGIVLIQDLTSDQNALHSAIDAVQGPRHDTPLAAAMCQAHCMLGYDEAIARYVITYTDGLENESQNFDMCAICEPCNSLMGTGWNYDCDPSNPSSCTDWQMCLHDQFSQTGSNIIHYFGEPINPFIKGGGSGLEDMYFLKNTAEESDGEFLYHSDQETICGDANGDGSLNVSDAVYLVIYIFQGGTPPPYMPSADCNCDSTINISDAVVIINNIFLGGDSPCDINGDDIPDC